MHHPDLERKLAELKAQQKKTLEEFRDLASEAISTSDRSCKTMMMFMPPPCTCEDDTQDCRCASTNGNGTKLRKTTRRLRLKKK